MTGESTLGRSPQAGSRPGDVTPLGRAVRHGWVALTLLLGLLAVLAAVAWWLLQRHGPGGDGVLAHLRLADGQEFLVTQQWQTWSEPYQVSFWWRQPDGTWGWCYLDHEATRWEDVTLEADLPGSMLLVNRGEQIEALFFLDRSTFAVLAKGGEERPAPQELRDPPFLPGTGR